MNKKNDKAARNTLPTYIEAVKAQAVKKISINFSFMLLCFIGY